MIRSFLCLAVLAFLSLSVATAEEKGKTPSPAKAPAADSAKTDPAAWLPKHLQGTHSAKRLIELQSQLEAANAKRGPARAEADKARRAAFQAEQKADEVTRMVKFLEEEKARVFMNAEKQLQDDARQKAAFETSQKVNKLESQLRELTAQLVSSKHERAQVKVPCEKKDKKAAAATPGKQEPAAKKEADKK